MSEKYLKISLEDGQTALNGGLRNGKGVLIIGRFKEIQKVGADYSDFSDEDLPEEDERFIEITFSSPESIDIYIAALTQIKDLVVKKTTVEWSMVVEVEGD